MAKEAFAEKELVRNFDRLQGTSLMAAGRSPIEIMVDQATGKQDHDLMLFLEFVRECIYDPLVRPGGALDLRNFSMEVEETP